MKVLVAMSGGVDSSVAAALLVADGHTVVGVTMRLWGGESDTGCCSVADVDDARRVAQQLGIDHVVFNFSDEFDATVVAPYVAAHAANHTPNPCIECNRHLKFDRLFERAELVGYDAVATGHHATVGHRDGRWTLERAFDRAKDQSYVVHMLDQDHLARTLLPIGGIDKAHVRATAARLGLRTATKPDSQDVCFVTSGGRAGFVGRRTALTPARVVDEAGHQIGAVAAIQMVTIGQRRGLDVAGAGSRRYVVDIDKATATVTMGAASALRRAGLSAERATWVDGPVDGEVLIQTSAHGRPNAAEVTVDGDRIDVMWHEPQRVVAPGQSVVLYDTTDTRVLGGAIAR